MTEIQTFVGEAEPERSEVQGHLCLHSESEDSLENMSPCLNITLNKTKLRSKLESIHMINKRPFFCIIAKQIENMFILFHREIYYSNVMIFIKATGAWSMCLTKDNTIFQKQIL